MEINSVKPSNVDAEVVTPKVLATEAAPDRTNKPDVVSDSVNKCKTGTTQIEKSNSTSTESQQQPSEDLSNSKANMKLLEKSNKADRVNANECENSQYEEEDVPQDFFDDFSNPDFMEGLNIVDAWDDQPDEGECNTVHKKSDEKKPEKKSKTKIQDRKKHIRRSRSRDRKPRSKDTKPVLASQDVHDKKKPTEMKKEKPKDESDLRRDPVKSKRDLQKYKVKCDKVKEQKTITEKLKVVETGLVPPGMEMDVDIEEVLKKAEEERREKCPELDDSWQSHPNTKSPNTVYPDLKPSAILPSDKKHESKKHSKSKGKNRSSIEYVAIGNSPLPDIRSPKSDRKRRSSSFRRSWRKSPHHENIAPDAHARRRASPSFGRVRRAVSPMLVVSSGYFDRKSPKRRSTSRGRVYARRSLSRDRNRKASRSRSRNRRSSSRGAFNRRRRSRSLSEREAWIRDPKRAWRRSRSRSRSPKRNRNNEKKDKKVPFIEEIRHILSNPIQNMPPNPMMHGWPQIPINPPRPHNIMIQPAPIPLPVPPPNDTPPFQFPTQPPLQPGNVPFDLYDQQFFIGDAPARNPPISLMQQSECGGPIPPFTPVSAVPNVPSGPAALSSVPRSEIANILTKSVIMPAPVAVTLPNLQIQSSQAPTASSLALDVLATVQSLASQAKLTAKEDAQKLYEEKKISLSDFLSMTTKLEDFSTATDLQQKIQVISQCQDVVKQLDGGIMNGRFVVKPQNRETSPEAVYRSPLLVTPVKYKSTTPVVIGSVKPKFGKILKKVLLSAGVAVDKIDFPVEEDKIPNEPPSPPAPPEISTKKSRDGRVSSVHPVIPSKQLMKMVQTDPFKCKACEERNDIIYIHSASQCSVSVRTVAVQTEDPVKDMLKNKSLASLTPAQLLMLKEKEKETGTRPLGEESRLHGNNHEHGYDRFSKPNYRDFSPSRNHFDPSPRGHFSPPRIHYSPPRRYASPPKHERSTPYVPTGHKDSPLPKKRYPPEIFSTPNVRPPFNDSTDRFFRH